jgi:hypothetical protein
MQIVSFHPGGVLTDLVNVNGVKEELYGWDDENLPDQFAVGWRVPRPSLRMKGCWRPIGMWMS